MTRTRSRHSARSRLVWTALAIAFCLVTAGSSALDGPSTAIADDPFTPPPIRHVWVINLENVSYAQSFESVATS